MGVKDARWQEGAQNSQSDHDRVVRHGALGDEPFESGDSKAAHKIHRLVSEEPGLCKPHRYRRVSLHARFARLAGIRIKAARKICRQHPASGIFPEAVDFVDCRRSAVARVSLRPDSQQSVEDNQRKACPSRMGFVQLPELGFRQGRELRVGKNDLQSPARSR